MSLIAKTVAAVVAVGAVTSVPALAQDAPPAVSARIVHFDVMLPLRNEAALDRLLLDQQRQGSGQYHRWLTPAEFKARFGADAEAMAEVRAAVTAAGLSVEAEHAASLRVAGGVAAAENLLGTRLVAAPTASGRSRLSAATELRLSDALQRAGARIVAFNPALPPMHVHFRRAAVQADNRKSNAGPYWFDDLKQAYDYPADNAKYKGRPLIGVGSTIGIVISSDVLDRDLDRYFDHEKYASISRRPNPTIHRRPVNGGARFDAKSDNSFEASLDVQQALGSAPGATLVLYNIPDLDDDSILAGDIDVVEDNIVDVASSSFGICELAYSPQWNGGTSFWGVLAAYDAIFRQGNAQGITWLASSGDSGGLDCPSTNYITGTAGPYRFVPGVETPADSPFVTGVGGTNLVTTAPSKGSLASRYVGENAYGDPEIPYDPFGVGANVQGGYWGAGGGLSVHYPLPIFQRSLLGRTTMRAIPDIGMQVGGCPAGISVVPCGPDRSAVFIYVGGKLGAVIGTSVASPEFAGVVALLVQRTGERVGNLNHYIYGLAAAQNALGGLNGPIRYYHRRIPGFDGLYRTDYLVQPYNHMTGNGTPDVRAWLQVPQLPPAGNPQTLSNP
jgi:subtilase family serine protease